MGHNHKRTVGFAPHFALLAPQHYTSSIKGFRDKFDLD
jgi:hypothetical protein